MFFNKYFSATGQIVDFGDRRLRKFVVTRDFFNEAYFCTDPSLEPFYESRLKISVKDGSLNLSVEVFELASSQRVCKVIVAEDVLYEAVPIPFDAFFIFLITSLLWFTQEFLNRYLPSYSLISEVLNLFTKLKLSSRYLI
ncbi:hypothetical protein QO059_07415 [Fervidobacterium islandicum]|uniref:hypothetical protein n=1 Tax=Fervidobacterium islandicum TaxID=2423 RepID=UPI003A7510DE